MNPHTLVLLLFLFSPTVAFCFTDNDVRETVRYALTFGNIIAVVISWSRNKSVFWALIHGILSWIYVFYFLLSRKPDEY